MNKPNRTIIKLKNVDIKRLEEQKEAVLDVLDDIDDLSRFMPEFFCRLVGPRADRLSELVEFLEDVLKQGKPRKWLILQWLFGLSWLLVLLGRGNILTHRKAIIGFKGQKSQKSTWRQTFFLLYYKRSWRKTKKMFWTQGVPSHNARGTWTGIRPPDRQKRIDIFNHWKGSGGGWNPRPLKFKLLFGGWGKRW